MPPSKHATQCECLADVLEFLLIRDHVEDDIADAQLREAAQLRADLGIAVSAVPS